MPRTRRSYRTRGDENEAQEEEQTGRNIAEQIDEEELTKEDFQLNRGMLEDVDDEDEDSDDEIDKITMMEQNAHIIEPASSGSDDDDDFEDSDDDVFAGAVIPKRKQGLFDDEVEDAENDYMEKSLAAWGRDKSTFYNTNFVDPDFQTDSEEEREAQEEEEEALLLQQREAQEYEEEDFALMGQPMIETTKKQKTTKVVEEVKDGVDDEDEDKRVIAFDKDLSKLSAHEREQILDTAHPGTTKYTQLLQQLVSEIKFPLSILKKNHIDDEALEEYISFRYRLVSTTALNISYLLARISKGLSTVDHECRQQLENLENMLERTTEVHDLMNDKLLAKAHEIKAQEKEKKAAKKKRKAESQEKKGKKKLKKSKKWSEKSTELNDDSEEGQDGIDASMVDKYLRSALEGKQKRKDEWEEANKPIIPEDDGRNEGTDGPRPINYAIKKNKGLLPSRKKEYRNPRVRNKNKFQKAKTRRKGQVRDAVSEIPVYTGEGSGIRRTLAKSVKLS